MLPLEGITIISIEQAVAAPFATRQLADLGARVVKIERPGVGDFARDYDETVQGMASHFVWLNRSKESVTFDLAARLLEVAGARVERVVISGSSLSARCTMRRSRGGIGSSVTEACSRLVCSAIESAIR